MLKFLLLFASLFATTAHAAPQGDSDPLRAKARVESYAPQRMELAYDLYRNGQKLGQVTDTYVQTGGHYTLTSEMRATGPLKMLWPGSIRLESAGNVTPQGLRPTQFQQARSDAPEKLATATLDWKAHRIAYRYKGESWTTPDLKPGAQDQLSQLYQFMFSPKLPTDYALQVVSGRDIKDYRYARSDGGTLATPVGSFATQQYQRIVSAPGDKAVTVWIAPARGNLPVRIRVVEDGVTLEQRLARVQTRGG